MILYWVRHALNTEKSVSQWERAWTGNQSTGAFLLPSLLPSFHSFFLLIAVNLRSNKMF